MANVPTVKRRQTANFAWELLPRKGGGGLKLREGRRLWERGAGIVIHCGGQIEEGITSGGHGSFSREIALRRWSRHGKWGEDPFVSCHLLTDGYNLYPALDMGGIPRPNHPAA